MDPEFQPLFEILGMTKDELESMSRKFVSIAGPTEDLFELCKIIVDKYGLEAVFMSLSMYRVLELAKSERHRHTVKPHDKETIDRWLNNLRATMSNN